MNRKTMLITATAGTGLLALLAWAFAPRPTEVELAVASVGSFETSIDEDARTRLHDRYSVSAPIAGRLQRVAINPDGSTYAYRIIDPRQFIVSTSFDL